MISLDTNVLVYASDKAEPAKQAVARDLVVELASADACIGLQVIGELQNVLRRKLRQPSWAAAQAARGILSSFRTFPATEPAAHEALTLMGSGRLGYWDALLITSARDAGVTTFFSEDMADGMRHGALEIVNPFSASGLSDRARAVLNR